MINVYGVDKKGIYFPETKSGNQSMVRADGSYKTYRKKFYGFGEDGTQVINGGIWHLGCDSICLHHDDYYGILADIHMPEYKFTDWKMRPLSEVTVEETEEWLFDYPYCELEEAISGAVEDARSNMREVTHSMDVMTILSEMNANIETLIAGVLHNTHMPMEKIEGVFGHYRVKYLDIYEKNIEGEIKRR